MGNGSLAGKQDILMREIADAASAAGIKVYLYGDTALAVRQGATPVKYEVCIFAKDAEKMIAALEKNGQPDRAIEGMFNNRSFPSIDFKYMDTTTLDFDIDSFWRYRNNCLGVDIRLITGKETKGLAGRRAKFLVEKRMQNKQSRVSFKRRVYIAGLSLATMGIDKDPMKAFRYVVGNRSDSGKKLFVDTKAFDSKIFKNTKTVMLADREFLMPEDEEAFLKSIFGKDWQQRKTRSAVGITKIKDENYSWEQFSKTISNYDFDDYDKRMSKWMGARREEGKYDKTPYSKLLARTHDRFTLWLEYKGKTDELKAALDSGDLEKLEKMFAPYTAALKRNYDNGLGLCFDPEIFEIYESMLQKQGKADYASKLRALIPEQHLKPIHIIQ